MRRMFTKEQVSFKFKTNDIEHLSSDMINELNVGDMVVKEEHNYIVTYKGDTGICMTYHDASCVETVSYDLINGVWTFNSKDVQSIVPYMENIVDNDFNKRFIEGTGTPVSVEGVTYDYIKWSLSGTHLMIVMKGFIEENVTLQPSELNVSFLLPEWIYNKIQTFTGVIPSRVDVKNVNIYDANIATSQTISVSLYKSPTSLKTVEVGNYLSFTTTTKRYFRIQFDVLVDAK